MLQAGRGRRFVQAVWGARSRPVRSYAVAILAFGAALIVSNGLPVHKVPPAFSFVGEGVLLGIPFAGTLMLILLAHEMGHYLYCLRYRVWASLPYFIPFPSLAGTMGAFIRIRSAIRSRAALFDIGIAGPIAGFIPAWRASRMTLAGNLRNE